MSRDKTADFLALSLVTVVCASVAYLVVRYFMCVVLMVVTAALLAILLSAIQIVIRMVKIKIKKQ